jgi:hypothetical protein
MLIPTLASIVPIMANESAIPAAKTKGPTLCSTTDEPMIIGSNGKTQGDSVDSTPARKAMA